MTDIAVVRLLRGLGDMLCLVPALRSLRAGEPSARVTVVGVPESRWVLDRFPHLVDGWLDVPWWRGVPEAAGDPHGTAAALAEARRAGFDLAMQLHGTGWDVNELIAALGAHRTAGHHPPTEPPPGPGWLPWPDGGQEIDRCRRVPLALGFPDAGTHLEWPERPDDVDGVAGLLHAVADGPYVVVHPGASRHDRRWCAPGFAAVARRVATAGGRVVVTAGPGERALAETVARHAGPAGMVADGRSLAGLGALVRRAAAVVSNDTGVAHLAVACDTPAVVVVTTSDAARWGPLDRDRHRVVPGAQGVPAVCAALAEVWP